MNKWRRFHLWQESFRELTEPGRSADIAYSWTPLYRWRDSAEPLLKSIQSDVEKKLELNRLLYKQFIDDLEDVDWDNFRPLRLSCEESCENDYSDWLSHFFGTSRTGYFLNQSLGLKKGVHAIKAEREIGSEGYRSDIMLTLSDGSYAHIEVKIGDTGLEKTYATAVAMQKRYKITKERLNNYILLMPEQAMAWADTIDPKWEFEIRPITWEDVVVAGRKSVYYSKENILWKTWMLGFVGAIESALLRIPIKAHVELSKINEYNTKLNILTRSLRKTELRR